MAFFARAKVLFKKHPVVSNMVLYGTLFGAGDLSQQTIRKVEKYDLKNSANIATMGACMYGPFYVYWYRYLDLFLPGTALRTVAKKLILDQAIAAPPLISCFYIGTSILEGQKDIFKSAIEKGPLTFLTGCAYWPAAQALNFLVVPPSFRTVYVAVASFVWTNILCFVKSMKIEGESDEAIKKIEE